MAIRTVLYDLDGTLVDNFAAIHLGMAEIARRLELPAPALAKVKAAVGGGVARTIGRLFGEPHQEAGYTIFQEHFPKVALEGLHVYAGVEWLLRELHGQGLRQAVLTNKEGHNARRIIAHLGLDRYLEAVQGTLDVGAARKPELAFTRPLLERLEAEPATTILIGDSPFDAETGTNANIPVHLVTTGSHSAEQLADTGAAGIYPNFHELGTAVFGLPTPQ